MTEKRKQAWEILLDHLLPEEKKRKRYEYIENALLDAGFYKQHYDQTWRTYDFVVTFEEIDRTVATGDTYRLERHSGLSFSDLP